MFFSLTDKEERRESGSVSFPPFPSLFFGSAQKKCNYLSFFSLMFSLIYVVPSHQEGFSPPSLSSSSSFGGGHSRGVGITANIFIFPTPIPHSGPRPVYDSSEKFNEYFF